MTWDWITYANNRAVKKQIRKSLAKISKRSGSMANNLYHDLNKLRRHLRIGDETAENIVNNYQMRIRNELEVQQLIGEILEDISY